MLVTTLAGLSGCALLSSPSIHRTEFFVLSATPDAGDAAAGRLSLGIGPVTIPTYLERPEMVVRIAENQVVFDEFNRWAEPLKANFVRVLAADLAGFVGVDQIVFYPWYETTPIDYAIGVNLLRFERSNGDSAVLVARWTVRDRKGAVLVARDAQYSRPASDATQTAAALSAMTGDLARDIGSALGGLAARR